MVTVATLKTSDLTCDPPGQDGDACSSQGFTQPPLDREDAAAAAVHAELVHGEHVHGERT